jgi:hypothetical protein
MPQACPQTFSSSMSYHFKYTSCVTSFISIVLLLKFLLHFQLVPITQRVSSHKFASGKNKTFHLRVKLKGFLFFEVLSNIKGSKFLSESDLYVTCFSHEIYFYWVSCRVSYSAIDCLQEPHGGIGYFLLSRKLR